VALLPDEAFISADRDLEVGDVAGEYRIEGPLGEGSYGTVYRAIHPVIGKSAAVKVLKRQYSANPEMVSRFIAEARAVNQIRHRNIIDIFAFGTLPDGRHYYVMELLEGQTLEALVKERQRLSLDEAIPILRQLSRALGAAHAAGILHRDIKPENVFLTFDEDGQPIPKLLDFGIAKLQSSDDNTHKTRSGTPMGTPLYMSPEQIRATSIDHRADIYSFGVLVHEVLTGSVPFDGTSVIDVLMKHTSAAPPAMSDVCLELPAILDSAVLHMLEKDPNARPSSIVAAMDALLLAAGMPLPPPSMTSSPLSPSRGGNRSSGPRSVPPAAGARTIAEPGRTLRGSSVGESSKPPVAVAPRRSWVPFVLVGVAVAVVAVLLGVRRFDPPTAGAMQPVAAPPTVAIEVSSAPTVTPTAVAAPPPSVSAVLPPTVTLTLKVTPPDADVYLGDDKLGSAVQPIELPRGEGTRDLTIRKPGWITKSVTVPAHEASTLTTDLVRAPTPGHAKGKKPGDLEF